MVLMLFNIFGSSKSKAISISKITKKPVSKSYTQRNFHTNYTFEI